MTTDNRTNEPTEAQVEAAAKAGHEYLRAKRPATHGPYDSWEELDEEYREYLRGIHRAALVAAARVAPQAESGHDWMTWEESGKNGTYCRNCGIWAGKSGGVACAPVQPSSTVDEAAKLHRPTLPGFGPKSCVHDGRAWPCPDSIALGLNEGENE